MLSTTLEHQIIARFKLKHLQMLVEVAKNGSISKAAEKMYVAQPAVTKTIGELEKHIGMKLFARSKRGVTLTDNGEIFIRHTKHILTQIRHASEELEAWGGGFTGHLTIGTLLAANPLLLPSSLVRIRSERPHISIKILEGTHDQLIPSLRIGDIDMVLGRLPEILEDEGVISEVLYREPVCVVVRNKHPLTAIKKLSLKDLLDYPWILPLADTTLREEVDNAFRAADLGPPVNTIESVSIFTNRKLLADSDMIAVMPYQVLRFYEQTGLLCTLPVQLITQLGPVGITLRKGDERTPALRYAIGIILETAKGVRQSYSKLISP